MEILKLVATLLLGSVLLLLLNQSIRWSEGGGDGHGVSSLIESYGYEVEEHKVVTGDGYILTLHRIPRGRHDRGSSSSTEASKKGPVLLGHCLLGSSATWTLVPDSLAYLLADEGYDVWMINIRGNQYSRKHLKLNLSDVVFWDFSHHESALEDYPATIDYILEVTGESDLFFAGYSMGTTQYLVLLSEKPEYNAKIRAGFLLAPTAVTKHSKSPLRLGSPYAEVFQSIINGLGFHEILPNLPEIKSFFTEAFCSFDFQNRICSALFAVLMGMKPRYIHPDVTRVIIRHIPAGSNTKTFTHMAQLFRNGDQFSKFDHGPEGNVRVYGTTHPARYNLSNVVAPTALIGGITDEFVGTKDVELLAEKISNPIAIHYVDQPEFGHLDFLINHRAKQHVHLPVIRMMNSMMRTVKRCSSSSINLMSGLTVANTR